MSLAVGPEFTSQGESFTPQEPINHALSTVPPHTPVACLILCENDEEIVVGVLRGAARERGVAYHHVELGDDGLMDPEVWSREGGWVMMSYSYLQQHPQNIWHKLTEVW